MKRKEETMHPSWNELSMHALGVPSAAVAAHLGVCPACRNAFESLRAAQGAPPLEMRPGRAEAMRSFVLARAAEQVAAAPQARREFLRRRRFVRLAVTALASAAALVYALFLRAPAMPSLALANAAPGIVTSQLQDGRAVLPVSIATEKAEAVDLAGLGTGRLRFRGPGACTVRRDGAAWNIALERGALAVDTGGPLALSVRTPHGIVLVAGTRFVVVAGGREALVAVADGTVRARIEGDAMATDVGPGRAAVLAEGKVRPADKGAAVLDGATRADAAAFFGKGAFDTDGNKGDPKGDGKGAAPDGKSAGKQRAERIFLKDGIEVIGRVVVQDGTSLTLESRYGRVVVARSNVRKIEYVDP